jgi:hypothetical protein
MRDQVVDALFQVRLELVVQIGVQPIRTECVAESAQ